MKKSFVLIISFLVLFQGCKTAYETVAPSKGEADFSTYVAIGNSLTAGYADGALYKSGQENSYPNILAGQFKLVGGGDFKQPLMADDNGGFSYNNVTYVTTKRVLSITTDCKGVSSLSPILASTSADAANINPIGPSGPYNNMGVPGVKSYQTVTPLLAGSPLNPFSANPYYWRMASSIGTSSMLSDALAQHPTFFTFWIGSNDVLLYATAGGEGSGEHVTGADTVASSINAFLGSLIAGGAKGGAIANVPDITSIPYFTTVPYNGLALDATSAAALSAAYTALGISFQAGANPFIIASNNSPYPRQIKSTEYLLLTVPQDSIKCAGWGSTKPIPAKYVLDEDEIAKVKTATTAYNSAIASMATTYNLALVDMNQKLTAVKSGVVYDGVAYSATFVTGGAFSLDGVHLTPQGYAIVANYYIEAINANMVLPYHQLASQNTGVSISHRKSNANE